MLGGWMAVLKGERAIPATALPLAPATASCPFGFLWTIAEVSRGTGAAPAGGAGGAAVFVVFAAGAARGAGVAGASGVGAGSRGAGAGSGAPSNVIELTKVVNCVTYLRNKSSLLAANAMLSK